MSRYTDMIRSTAAEIYAETGAPSVVSIKFDRGSFNGVMPQLFPLAAGDMKRIFSILDRVPDYNDALTAAETVRTFCADMIRIYNDLAKSYSTPDGKTFCAAQVKRYADNINAVADRYGLDRVDVEKAPRMKAAPVFVLENDGATGAPRVACYDGKKFEKAGRTWHVYGKKCGRKTTYHIIDPDSGRSVATVSKASAAAGALTDQLLRDLEKVFSSEKYSAWTADFKNLLRRSEYAYMINDAGQAPQEATTATETAPAQSSAETPATAAAEPGQEEHGAASPATDPAETARTTCTAEELDRGPAATAETPQKARTTCKDAATGRRSATAHDGLIKRRQALRRLAIYGGARPVILRRVHGHGAPTVPRAAEGHINVPGAAEARQKTPGGPAAVYDHTGAGIVLYCARSGPIKDPRRTVDRSTCGHTGRQRHDVRSSCGPAAGYIPAPWEAIKGPPRTAARTAQRFKRVLTCCGWTCYRC